MSVSRSVSGPVSRRVSNRLARGSSGGGAFSPLSLSTLRQYALDGGEAYHDSTVGGYPVLRSLESHGTHRQPRQGRYYVADGVDDYIAVASLVGTETVVSSGGTGTPSISAGRIDLTAGTYWDIVLSNGSHYPCNEESGTTSYDIDDNAAHGTITNATLGTFRGTGSTRTANRNNSDGYRLSGSVYIPKRLGSDLAADGNALTATGKSPYPINVEVPCVTGNGANVYCDLGSPLIPATADFSCEIVFKQVSLGSVLALIDQAGTHVWVFSGQFYWGPTATHEVFGSYSANTWYRVVFTRVGDLWTLTATNLVTGVTQTQSTTNASAATQSNTRLFVGDGQAPGAGVLSDLSIATGGVTTYFPLQDGPGTSNTNRDLAYIKSDGTYGIASAAIINGTVSDIWANRCPHVEDWCVNYGGDIAANGAFLPGQISGSLAADGTAKTLEAGKFGNPYSRVNFNPFTAAELNGLGTETAYAVGAARQSVSPADTKFRRTAAAGDDRLITTSTALTGDDKTNTEGYVA